MKSKKHKPARTRDWGQNHEGSFTHDRARHRKAEAAPPSSVRRATLPTSEQITPNAVVISHTGQWAFVRKDDAELLCLLDGMLGEGRAPALAPGDLVLVDFAAEQPIIRAVAPRRSKLSRLLKSYTEISEQVIAANVDLLVIVASAAKPRFKPGLVDRYMIAAEIGGVMPLLVVNKMDLADEEPTELDLYRGLGLTVIGTSCEDGRGIDTLLDALRGKLAVLAGHSGVGKSSLLNAMDPSLDIATREVSDSNDKGKHTTSGARMYVLDGDIRIIDTPGVRSLGVWDVSTAELAFYFPEMEELAIECRFRDCTHIHEPSCAVREAVEAGRISMLRFESYLRIRTSIDS